MTIIFKKYSGQGISDPKYEVHFTLAIR